MAARSYAPAFPLKHQQKDLRLALALGDRLGQALPTAATANELYKVVRAAARRGDGKLPGGSSRVRQGVLRQAGRRAGLAAPSAAELSEGGSGVGSPDFP